MSTTEGGLLDTRRVAELLGVSKRTIYNWVQHGRFPPPLRLGPGGRTLRWTPAQIYTFLKSRQEFYAALKGGAAAETTPVPAAPSTPAPPPEEGLARP
jgi:excisionase family DNA binding protein